MWVAVDDTDGPDGGCTTYTLTEVIATALECGLDLIGEPRLVRLDPNIPGKTRGNAALAACFGHGTGPRRRQGQLPRGPVWSRARGRSPSPAESEDFLERAWSSVRRTSTLGTPGTDPVLVSCSRRPGPGLYREAVGRWVDPVTVEPMIERLGASVRAVSDRGAIVGTMAALAWPGRRATWELIAYREAARWGSRREVDASSVHEAQRRHPELFLCHDPRTRRLLVAPHTACPILFGLRSRDRGPLPSAAANIRSEPVERWMIFRTNQGTGDHAQLRSVRDLRAYDAATLRGAVNGTPARLPGGHVRWELRGEDGRSLTCFAFEPTKTLPAVAAALRDGDRIEVWGGRGADPTFRVEGIRFRSRSRSPVARRAPRCPSCSRRTRSLGRGRGFRCPSCRLRLPLERAVRLPAEPTPAGVYHPTPSARRHLAPLGPEPYATT